MEPSKEMKDYMASAKHHGRVQYDETMRAVLAQPTPAAINYELESMEEFAISCIAHHIFNHGIGAHYSTVTPFGTWNPSQAFVKEQEVTERIMVRVKQVKEQYQNKKGTIAPIDPNFKGTGNENADK